MSPRAGDRRKITGRQIGAAGAGAAMIAIAIGVLSNIGGSGSNIPTPAHDVVRIDILASRDLDTTTPCGLPAGGENDKLPLVTDQTWTRTGGSSCYPISATTAQCFNATEVPYTVDATGLGWVVEPDAVNRIIYSTAIDCTNWTCTTATIAATAVAPDGTATAAEITMGGGSVEATATGYTNSTALTTRMWAKCSSGTLDASNVGGAGHWTVNCTTVGGNWALLHSAHTAVTEVQGWQSTGAGAVVLTFSGADATIWAPTLTEEPGTGLSVIPTGAAAVSTGDPEWAISNGLRNTGAQLLVDGDMEAVGVGDWTVGNGAVLTKDTSAPLIQGAQHLRVSWGVTTFGYAKQSGLTIGKTYRITGWGRGDGTNNPRAYDGGVTSLWAGSTSTDWQAFDASWTAKTNNIWLYANMTSGYVEFDDITVYEQESYGAYYRPGDTVTQTITEISGNCWDSLTTTGDLLLSGVEGTNCAGIWYGLQVTP